ncbi:MAG: hypothetical protein DHS20C06_04570 [Hyphobacterium sp.]|nr:MAG: hypothetical protein DHS20C06_04570 [Hyphobacterium sp.]
MTPQHKTILTGIAVFLIFAVFVTGFSPVAPRYLESRLDAMARDSLSAREFRWARVSVDGQVATLSGRWPDEGARDAALEAIWTSEWAGGWFSGGVSKVVDLSVAQQGETTSRFIARFGADGLSISGIAPSDAARDELMAMVQVLFPGRTNVRLAARSNPDANRGWAQAGGQLLAGLARLDVGAAILDSNAAVLYGIASDPASAEAALEAYQAAPSPFTPVGWVMADDSNYGDATSAGNCGRLLEAALLMGRMRFNPGSSAISAEGRAGLEHVAGVISACPEDGLLISVRPVVAGDLEAETLAEARGETVKSTLAAFGLDAATISVVVNGEQDQLVRITPDDEGEG